MDNVAALRSNCTTSHHVMLICFTLYNYINETLLRFSLMLIANAELGARPVEPLNTTGAFHAEPRVVSASPAHRDPANVMLALEVSTADPEVLVGRARHTGTLVRDALLDGPLAVTAETAGTATRGVRAHLSPLQLGVTGSVDGDHENGRKHKEEHGGSHFCCF